MVKGSRWAVVLLLAAGCGRDLLDEPPPPPPASPPVPLFNGKDLTGWVRVLDSKWVAEGGALVARQDPKGRLGGESWLMTEREYGDFLLTLKFKTAPGGAGGVFLRDPVPPAERLRAAGGGPAPRDVALEVSLSGGDPDVPTGSLRDVAKAPPGLQRQGEWNELMVKAQGSQVHTWVNGRLAAAGRARAARGAIGFRLHGGEGFRDKVVEFKDILIREIR